MINGWKLAVLAAISGGLSGSIGSEAIEGDVVEPMSPPAELIQKADRVSVEFNNASVREVLDWLKHKKINFVAAESELDRDQKITLNVENAPLADVVNSIATALGGRWVKDGEMRVFKRGQASGGFGGSNFYRYAPSDEARKEVEEAMKARMWADKDGVKFYPDLKFDFKNLPGNVWVHPNWQEMSKEDRAKFEEDMAERMKHVPGTVWVHPNWDKMSPADREKFEKDMAERMRVSEKAMEEAQRVMELRMKDMPTRIFMSPDLKKMSPEERAKFEKEMGERMKISEKAMEEAQRAMELRMKDMPTGIFMSPDWHKMSPEERAKFEKEMAETMKVSEKAREEMMKHFGEDRVWLSPGKEGNIFKFDEKAMKDLPGITVLRSSNLKELVSSLSKDQLEKHRKTGFLTPGDLTEKQRNMLGMVGKGDWSIVYSADGKKITFKSKR